MLVIDSRTLALMVREELLSSIEDLIFLMDDAIEFCHPDRYETFLETRFTRDAREYAISLAYVRPYWYFFELGVPIEYLHAD